jgi:hypothetical protein
MHSSSNQIMEDIAKLQEEYYQKNQKNVFFKKSQKHDCATMIASTMDKHTLFSKTLNLIPEKHIIYYDYTVFKTYMTPDLYDEFLQYEFNLTHEWVESIDTYELHLNIQGLSISAFERYRGFIEKVLNRYPPISPTAVKMNRLHVYYTPSIIEQILNFLSPFIQHLRDKLIFYSKAESPAKLIELFSV